MEKGILNDVIVAEKDIQACIEEEQARLRVLVEGTRRETEEQLAEEERSYGVVRDRERERALREAEAQARRIVEDATAAATRLDALDERALAGIVLKRIPRILLE